MTTVIIFAIAGWLLAAGEIWNLQRALRHGVIRSKGDHRKDAEPKKFWDGFAFHVFGLIFAVALASLSTYAILATQ